MTNKWNDKSWQKDFLNMKSHSPSDAKLLMGGVKGLKDAWRLGVLHVEYERLKKKQMQEDQQSQRSKKILLDKNRFNRKRLMKDLEENTIK